jgi:hypothetical protein
MTSSFSVKNTPTFDAAGMEWSTFFDLEDFRQELKVAF